MKCQAILSGVWGGECVRDATVERDGKFFCWQHDPERVRAEREARCAKRKEEARKREAEREARWTRDDLMRDSGVSKLTNEELKHIIDCGGIQNILHPE